MKMSNSFIKGFSKQALNKGVDPDDIADIIRRYFGINMTHSPNTDKPSTAVDLIDRDGVNDTNNII